MSLLGPVHHDGAAAGYHDGYPDGAASPPFLGTTGSPIWQGPPEAQDGRVGVRFFSQSDPGSG